LHCFEGHCLKAGAFDRNVVWAWLEVGDGKCAVIARLSLADLPGFNAGDFDLGFGDESVVGIFDGAHDGAFVILGQGGSGENQDKQGSGE
jgi:hypothetical protein